MAGERFDLEADDASPPKYRWVCTCGEVGPTWEGQDQAAFRGASHVEGHRASRSS
jgi:hypothetical protein